MKKLKKENRKVLVTGAYGYIGSWVAKELGENDIESCLIDKVSLDLPNSHQFDLRDSQKSLDCVEQFKPDLFIHCATHSALAYQQHFADSFREDCEILTSILAALSKRSHCRFVYLSSSYVYSGLPEKTVVNEESPLKPIHNFGVAKSFFEQFALKQYSDTVALRLFSVFGPGNYLFPNSVHNMIQECRETGRVTIWGEGKRKMQYVFIRDVLKAIEEACFLEPGIYNVGGNEYLSVAETAKNIAALLNADVVFVKDKKEGETLPFGDNAKFKQACGKDCFTSFEEALKEYLA
ncbi:MAG: hypothetical protein A2W61_05640 [Deltaproteobacteria bacterium RIFCSPLOWO2_01_44_7]|nr:MAG: hypothetical protein A2W61_05640 [Deltaproteobacteria bacterium RIFCSPLOWO2_01_44_7]